jgi:hypothetical protein
MMRSQDDGPTLGDAECCTISFICGEIGKNRQVWHRNNTGACGIFEDTDGDQWLRANIESFRRKMSLFLQYLIDLITFIDRKGYKEDSDRLLRFLHRRVPFSRATMRFCAGSEYSRYKYILAYLYYGIFYPDYIFLPKLLLPKSYRKIRRFINDRK